MLKGLFRFFFLSKRTQRLIENYWKIFDKRYQNLSIFHKLHSLFALKPRISWLKWFLLFILFLYQCPHIDAEQNHAICVNKKILRLWKVLSFGFVSFRQHHEVKYETPHKCFDRRTTFAYSARMLPIATYVKQRRWIKEKYVNSDTAIKSTNPGGIWFISLFFVFW